MIKNDKIYIYPTDTVWGIGCSINSEIGFKEIAKIKKTDSSKPISILFTSFEEIEKYLTLPIVFKKEVFLKLMSLELTLLFPIAMLKIDLPIYLQSLSQFVSVRLLTTPVLCKLREEISSPFFTTSLNLHGEDPIVSSTSAIIFKDKFCPDAIFVSSDDQNNLSGTSSSILKISMNNDILTIRSGKNLDEIKNYLLELNLHCI